MAEPQQQPASPGATASIGDRADSDGGTGRRSSSGGSSDHDSQEDPEDPLLPSALDYLAGYGSDDSDGDSVDGETGTDGSSGHDSSSNGDDSQSPPIRSSFRPGCSAQRAPAGETHLPSSS